MTIDSRPSFGTDGIRGLAGEVLTPYLLMQLGYAIGNTLPKTGAILIGNDSRRSSAMLVSALIAGLTSAGREIWTLGLCPTAAVSILIQQFGAAGGIMVSASHNPPEDNGIKVFNENGFKIDPTEKNLIESQLNYKRNTTITPEINNNYGRSFHRNELLNHYLEGLLSSVSNTNLIDVPIVLDLCWGSATAFGEKVFKALGANLFILNGEANGDLINVNCGSTNLNPLRECVLKKGAEMGFAFDGDSDRMLAVDGKGRVIDGDHVLYLWGKFLQEKNELPDQRLVATIMSNLGFEKAWQDRGGILERTPVGDQHVHSAMLKKGAVLGGEQSGHILSSKNNFCGDGLLTALQLATICHSKQLSLAQWRDQSFKSFPQRMINIKLSTKFNYKNLEECYQLQETLFTAKQAMGDNGRVILRESGTEPLIRIMVEAEEQYIADKWAEELANIVNTTISN